MQKYRVKMEQKKRCITNVSRRATQGVGEAKKGCVLQVNRVKGGSKHAIKGRQRML